MVTTETKTIWKLIATENENYYLRCEYTDEYGTERATDHDFDGDHANLLTSIKVEIVAEFGCVDFDAACERAAKYLLKKYGLLGAIRKYGWSAHASNRDTVNWFLTLHRQNRLAIWLNVLRRDYTDYEIAAQLQNGELDVPGWLEINTDTDCVRIRDSGSMAGGECIILEY